MMWYDRIDRPGLSRLVNKIRGWDCNDVRDLLDWLRELEASLAKDPKLAAEYDEYRLFFMPLPSAPIPKEVDTTYPVWAMDRRGYCLVHEPRLKIEHVGQVLERQREWARRVRMTLEEEVLGEITL